MAHQYIIINVTNPGNHYQALIHKDLYDGGDASLLFPLAIMIEEVGTVEMTGSVEALDSGILIVDNK